MNAKYKELVTRRGVVAIMREGIMPESRRAPRYRVAYRYEGGKWVELVPFTRDTRRAFSACVRQVNLMDAPARGDLASHDKPLAAPGLTSFRCRGRFGWIMIGAKDIKDAMREARRSDDSAKLEDLQIWNGERYISART